VAKGTRRPARTHGLTILSGHRRFRRRSKSDLLCDNPSLAGKVSRLIKETIRDGTVPAIAGFGHRAQNRRPRPSQLAHSMMDLSLSLETQSNLSKDHQEAVWAFAQKRRPNFTGH
jgi:hypothetical protein